MARDLAHSSDGSRLLVGIDAEKSGWLADPPPRPTDARIGQPLAHEDRVLAVAFSPDGTRMVTGGRDKTARIWEVVEHKPIGRLEHKGWLWRATFSPDGSFIATGAGENLHLWDADTLKLVHTIPHDSVIRGLAFSHDSSWLLTGTEKGTVQLWDVASRQSVGEPLRLEGPATFVAFSPDGSRIIAGGYDGKVQFWDRDTGNLVGPTLEHDGGIFDAALSPDGTRIVTGSWGDVTGRIWDSIKQDPVSRPLLDKSDGLAVDFSPDGTRAVISSGGMHIFDVATGKHVVRPTKRGGRSVTFSPDGSLLLTAAGQGRLWDAQTGIPLGPPLYVVPLKPREATPGDWRRFDVARAAAFSPDGTRILTSFKGSHLWEAPPPPVPGTVKRLELWIEVATGIELDPYDAEPGKEAQVLDAQTWRSHRQALAKLGGPPAL